MISLIIGLVIFNTSLIVGLYWLFFKELSLGRNYYVDCPLSDYEHNRFYIQREDLRVH